MASSRTERELPFRSLIRSQLFTFYVGEAKTPFQLHGEAIGDLSPTLNVLLYGPMEDAKTKRVVWDHVDEDTFTRFCQFAYTGDYDTPLPAIEPHSTAANGTQNGEASTSEALPLPDPSEIDAVMAGSAPPPPAPVPPPPAEDDVWGDWGFSSKKKKKKKQAYLDIGPPAFDTLDYPNDPQLRVRLRKRDILPNHDTYEDFTPVFLGHARLYVLADEKGVDSLKQLALQKLRKTLACFTIMSPNRVDDLVELVKYTYTNTASFQDDSRWDELRTLVVLYWVAEVSKLSKSEEFLALMEERGQFARDFWRKFQEHLTERETGV